MDETIKIAESLGAAIAKTPQFQDLKRLETDARADKEISTLTKDYQDIMQRLTDLERNLKPIEVEDKKKFETLRTKVLASEKIQTLLKAQTEYTEMMSGINRAITAPLKIEEDEK